MENKKVVLIILDGWGIGKPDQNNAIHIAKTPFFDSLIGHYPSNTLEASGEAVGLPAGQMGNSEVGHLNIGAGRIVYQELARINKAFDDLSIYQNKTLLETIKYLEKTGKKLHLMGLLSDGGVHSHIKHLIGLLDLFHQHNITNVLVHAFLDGRDTDPKSGKNYLKDLVNYLPKTNAKLATVIGRYYAMDRDNRWERVKKAYDLLVHGIGKQSNNFLHDVEESYDQNTTDEFMLPIVNSSINTKMEEGDAVICFNFRTDRAREITKVLTQQDLPDYGMLTVPLNYVTLTKYDDSFNGVGVVFEKDNLQMTLGEVLQNHHKKQIRIAETEKYPHVTFFFSGGRETPFEGEKRILIPSAKVATYDQQPEMSAQLITNAIIPELKKQEIDFICLNFANPDMVGHTGVFGAVVKAVETVDSCTEQVVKTGLDNEYSFVIIADHGNADYMINEDGSPNTAHTTNLVPIIIIDKDVSAVKQGKLGDLAPTILKMMGINKPDEMTGEVLI